MREELARGLEVGDWKLDISRAELRCPAHTRHLEPRQLALLVHLAERAGQIVDKGELLDAVWCGAVVEEVAVPRCISELRKAMGDDARKPTYIQTEPRRGYRLIADVRPLIADVTSPVPGDSHDRPLLLLMAAFLVTTAVLTVLRWLVRER